MGFIQGSSRDQSTLFPSHLDDFVTENNPVRFIEAFVEDLDMNDLGFHRATPRATGRPGYDPKDMLKLFIYGYLYHLRSSRKLERETHRNVELMWLLRHLKPDFKTIADFRKDNKKGIKGVFKQFTLLCKGMNLFGCEFIGIDGSKFKGVNSESRNYTRKRLDFLLKQVNDRIEKYLTELETQDEHEAGVENPTRAELQQKMGDLKKKKTRLVEIEKRMDEGEAQVSLTDPDARAMVGRHRRVVGYNVQIGVDHKHKLLAAVSVTQDRCDANQLHPVSKRVQENLEVEAFEVIADKGYYNHDQLGKCLQDKIKPWVPPQRHSPNSHRGLFTKADFTYDPVEDIYTCPAGQVLKPLKHRTQTKRMTYRANGCEACTLRNMCTTSKVDRKLSRSRNENQIDELEKQGQENGFYQNLRKGIVEHPFGILKTSFQFETFLTKGLENVQTEMTLSALAYNFRRVLNIIQPKDLLKRSA